jgi:NAD(P)-dependent dehydrogenase (short-subunit alcohol dehydrogenase family)
MAPQEVILITGANTGIGFQIVRALCGSDTAYDVILGGRSLDKVQEAIRSATAEFPSSRSKLSPLQVDIEHDNSIKKAFDEVQSKFGRLDALVNNAGMHACPEPSIE